jgi:hypothetical protein
MVTVLGLDVVPSVREPNDRLVGDTVTGATPLPESATA